MEEDGLLEEERKEERYWGEGVSWTNGDVRRGRRMIMNRCLVEDRRCQLGEEDFRVKGRSEK